MFTRQGKEYSSDCIPTSEEEQLSESEEAYIHDELEQMMVDIFGEYVDEENLQEWF